MALGASTVPSIWTPEAVNFVASGKFHNICFISLSVGGLLLLTIIAADGNWMKSPVTFIIKVEFSGNSKIISLALDNTWDDMVTTFILESVPLIVKILPDNS